MNVNTEAEKMFEAIRMNELEEAAELFDNSLRKSLIDYDVEGLAEFAAALYQVGFLDNARDAYLLLKDMAPELDEWNLFLAEIAIDQNRVEEGLDLLLEFDKDSDLYPHALLSLADAYQTLGLYEVSEQKIKEAMMLLPDEPVLQFALAKLHHTTGKYQQAISLYEQLIDKDTQDAWRENLYILLADCYNAIGMFEEAVANLEEVLADDHTADSLFQLGFDYLQLNEYERAIQVLQDLISKDPDYMSAYLHLSDALDKDLRTEEALEIIKEGIALDPYQANLFLAEAKLYLKNHQLEKAENSIGEALALDPELAEAMILRIDLLMEQERYEDVIAILDNDEKEFVPQPRFEWMLAKAYNEEEDFDKASAHFDKAYFELFDNLTFLEEYSQFLLEEGNMLKLSEVVEQALDIQPENQYFIELKEDRLRFD